MKTKQKISVLIPTRDHPHLLEKCIDHISKADSKVPLEVIVLDGSTNEQETMEILSKADLKTLTWVAVEQYWNFSQINNHGVKHSNGTHLLFLNDDCFLNPDFFLRLGDLPSNEIWGFRLLYESGYIQHAGAMCWGPKTTPLHIAIGADPKYYHPPDKHRVLAATMACLLVPRSVNETVGGLDEGFFFAYEDMDYCLRAAEKGFKTFVRNDVEATHLGHQSGELMRQLTPKANPYQNMTIFSERWLANGKIDQIMEEVRNAD